MTGTQIVGAYRAVRELLDVVLPYRASREIARLKKRLDEEFSTVLSMEQALVKKYGGESHENGKYHFPSPEDTKAFAEELSAAMRQEDHIKLPQVDLSPYSGLIRVSADAIEALEGLVVFDEAGEEATSGG